SDRNKNAQLQLFRTLIVQFSIPFIFCVFPFAVIAPSPITGLGFGQTANLLEMLISIFPSVDPFVVILSMPAFRRVLSGWTDHIRQALSSHYSITVLISLLGNGLLISVVLNKTSRTLDSYRVLLVAFACMDITVSLVHAYVLPVYVTIEYGLIVFMLDTVHLPPNIGSGITYLSLFLFYESFPLLAFHFIYRYLALSR
ncbi:hypothetical protein PENTCL1PPCAC_14354, partial [Pristionchus entomophagus]